MFASSFIPQNFYYIPLGLALELFGYFAYLIQDIVGYMQRQKNFSLPKEFSLLAVSVGFLFLLPFCARIFSDTASVMNLSILPGTLPDSPLKIPQMFLGIFRLLINMLT